MLASFSPAGDGLSLLGGEQDSKLPPSDSIPVCRHTSEILQAWFQTMMINQAHEFFWFPSVYKSYAYTIFYLSSVQ